LSLGIEKPLLRGAGITANEAKINIAREFYFRAAHDVQQAMNYLARTVRRAYWDLNLAYRLNEIQSQALSQVATMSEQERKRYQLGSSTTANVAQARELYERIRALHLESERQILAEERRLRQLIGIPSVDDKFFTIPRNVVQSDPTSRLSESTLEWEIALECAMTTRPELAAQRHHIAAYRHEVGLRENETLPDVSVLGKVSISGLDNELPESFNEMLDGDNRGWAVGMVYRRPVNNCLANALLRRAQLHVAQQQAVLEQLMHTAQHELRRAYNDSMVAIQRYEIQSARVEAALERLVTSRKQFSSRRIGSLDYLLRAQESHIDALLSQARAAAELRKSLEEWDYQRGVILTRQWQNAQSAGAVGDLSE
jgi:outer membrane protein TolC